MSTLDKIYSYFNNNSKLKVLFIFRDKYLLEEIRGNVSSEYIFEEFRGNWFTIKYKLDNEWSNSKVILYFDMPSPLEDKSLQSTFALMDVLVANIVFGQQDHIEFMRQHKLDNRVATFVEKNIQLLRSQPMASMLEESFKPENVKNVNDDLLLRAILSHYLGIASIQDWDSILLEIILLSHENNSNREQTFYKKVTESEFNFQKLNDKVKTIFGTGLNKTSNYAENIVEKLKYNAIAQNLTETPQDTYKATKKITDAIALQHINNILEKAVSNTQKAKMLFGIFDTQGAYIKDDIILDWYGIDNEYHITTPKLAIRILGAYIEKHLETDPDQVLQRVVETSQKHLDNNDITKVSEFATYISEYYRRANRISKIALDDPDQYIQQYEKEFYALDTCYRKSVELFYNQDTNSSIYSQLKTAKQNLDFHYYKITNNINLEWVKCLNKKGINSLSYPRQWKFYDTFAKPKSRVAVIVSDALRYEMAKQLVDEFRNQDINVSLSSAISTLPTETKYGKPSLFPYSELKFYGSADKAQNMSVDNRILSSASDKTAHLCRYKAGSLSVTFDDVANKNNDSENIEIFKKPLVYIFHNAIDNLGHERGSSQNTQIWSNELTKISQLIKKMFVTYGVSNLYLTSDHGFVFNDIIFQDKDKQKVDENALEQCSRYYITESNAEIADVSKFSLNEVSGMCNGENFYVAVPNGINRFLAKSGGYDFAHGGIALQEIIIPIVSFCKSSNTKKEYVNVSVLDNRLSVQSSFLKFNIIQDPAVNDDNLPREIDIALLEDGKQVSTEYKMKLDRTDELLDGRKFSIKLTVNQSISKPKLQLRICDINDMLNPLVIKDVDNKQLIQNDFGF